VESRKAGKNAQYFVTDLHELMMMMMMMMMMTDDGIRLLGY